MVVNNCCLFSIMLSSGYCLSLGYPGRNLETDYSVQNVCCLIHYCLRALFSWQNIPPFKAVLENAKFQSNKYRKNTKINLFNSKEKGVCVKCFFKLF